MAARAALREVQIEQLLSRVSFSDADLILVKGWAHARLFPEPGLRPNGDVDLFVLPGSYERVLPVFKATPPVDPQEVVPVDLQTTWVDLPDRTWGQIYAHSRVVPLRSAKIRILGPEDDLRLSCLHLLRHAVEQPPSGNLFWLCDVSVILENLPDDFDWDYCLAGRRAHSRWILALSRLANEVLGANLDRCPVGRLPESVPSWMVNTFLRVWGHLLRDVHPRPYPLPVAMAIRDIRDMPRALTERWPSPLQSIYRLSWPISGVPGRLAQVADYTARAISWAPRQLGNREHATVG
jgi:hypothetical protein